MQQSSISSAAVHPSRSRSRRDAPSSRGSLFCCSLVVLSLFVHLPGVITVQNFPRSDAVIPLRVTNHCPETIWPGIHTQAGVGPGTGGFELLPGTNKTVHVGTSWQGRVWGRTNCTFNANGTGPGDALVANGMGASCMTGDCFGKLDCTVAGAAPATLAEFNMKGGSSGTQTFYDISLVDGYNLPIGIVYIPSSNMSDVPPNLTNPTCIATADFLSAPAKSGPSFYASSIHSSSSSPAPTNQTYPTPWEFHQDNGHVGHWCPWPLQLHPPPKPGDGVFPYPDDHIARPVFDPCLSACAATGAASDCCTGRYGSSSSCASKAGKSLYSRRAKAVCPDAYSYAFDDATSTFAVPAVYGGRGGAAWEVVFCPRGARSSNILAVLGPQLQALGRALDPASSGADRGALSEVLATARNLSYIEMRSGGSPASGEPRTSLAVTVMMVAAVAIIHFS
ncbi:hypothetical protein VTK73DRAFT_9342 [Phialemonium thermophilum]|uniref:Osmotin, thaumatin-like protein n=1 Tax=Phialemonium thermophilum TaxID=223376 RepID=A0ABR3XL69_9PEZI